MTPTSTRQLTSGSGFPGSSTVGDDDAAAPAKGNDRMTSITAAKTGGARAHDSDAAVPKSRFARLLRSPTASYAMIGIAATAIIIVAMAVLASIMVEGWASRDVALRARLVYLAIHDQVAVRVGEKSDANLVPFFDRIAEDERVLALGFCSATGKMELATSAVPTSVKCGNLPLARKDTYSKLSDAGRTLRVSIFPMV